MREPIGGLVAVLGSHVHAAVIAVRKHEERGARFIGRGAGHHLAG